ncbi:hypothetical protein CPBF1521_44460 [Xanthomonas arboricola pv. juglandis]|nr:hypothetical protein CPBF1521_44460 [Xanthomonas arboricola pv. juglandis]
MKVAVVVPLLPSLTLTSSIDSAGSASSLTMVPWPWPSPTLAPVTLLTLTKKVSFGSLSVSPLTSTVKVALLLPAGMVCPVRLEAT